MNILRNQTTNLSLQFSPEEYINISSSPSTVWVYCEYRRRIYEKLDSNAKLILITLFSITGVFGVFSNIVVVFAIHKTNQLTIQSIKLFRVLSILDTFNSMSNFFHLKSIVQPFNTSCNYLCAMHFVLYFGIYNSTFMVAVVALDRFLHIFYLQNYNSVFTVPRFRFAITITLLMSVYQSCATVVSIISNRPGGSGKYTFHLNVLCFVSVIFFYTASLVKLKTHSQVSLNISNTQRSILRITAMYFYFYLVNLASLLLFQILFNWTDVIANLGDESDRRLVGTVYFNIPAIIGTVNAIAFLWINRRSRDWLKSFFRPNRVAAVEAQQNAQPIN